MDDLSNLSKEVARLKAEFEGAMRQVRADSEMLLQMGEDLRLLLNWRANWSHYLITQLPDECTQQLTFILQRVKHTIEGKLYAKNRVREEAVHSQRDETVVQRSKE